jgi:hypothetical protein
MVEIIGLVMMGVLIGLLAWSMAALCESEKRRIAASRESGRSAGAVASDRRTRHAA